MNYTYGKNDKDRPVQKTLSFGSYPEVALLEARAKRDEAKALLRDGKDPAIECRVANKVKVEASENTFEKVARRWHDLKKSGFGTAAS